MQTAREKKLSPADNLKLAAVDCETTGVSWIRDRILGTGIHTSDNRSFYFIDPKEFKKRYKSLIEQGFLFVNHNTKFDWLFLKQHRWIEEDFEYYFDTKTSIPQLIDRPSTNELEHACVFYLKAYPWKDAVHHKNMENEDPSKVREYCILDCQFTVKLAAELINRLAREGQLDFFLTRLMPLDKKLALASYYGIFLDSSAVHNKKREYAEKLADAKNKFRTKYRNIVEPYEQLMLAEKLTAYKTDRGKQRALTNPPQINLSSNQQLLELLTKFAGLPMRGPDGRYSVNKDSLFLNRESPLVQEIIEIRDLEKPIQFFNTWNEVQDNNSRVHTLFNVDIARTGRLSSSGDLNAQQIPTRKDPTIRKVFTATPGHKLIIRDLASIEPRILAHYSHDKTLLQIFMKNQSLYGVSAVKMGLWDGDPETLKKKDKAIYNVAKTIVLGIFYNKGERSLAFDILRDTGLSYSYRDCRGFIDMFMEGFPGFVQLRDQAIRKAESRGYLKNLFGRRVFVSKQNAYMTSLNTLIQSSASDFMCFSQMELSPQIEALGGRLLLFVHDEVIWEVPDASAFVVDKIVDTGIIEFGRKLNLRVPIVTEGGVSTSWGDQRVSWNDVKLHL